MNLYDVWVNGDGTPQLISQMDTQYIINCVNQIKKSGDNYRMTKYEDLTKNDLKFINNPLYKAWFVLNARDYLTSFKNELENRNEDTSFVDEVICYIDITI